jgi:nitrite reductase/ring-hydroxylating ferredoxin subunit
VAALPDIPEGEGKRVRVGLAVIVLFKIKGELFAVEGLCRHMKAPLEFARVQPNQTITCGWHGWQYDLASGQCLTTSWAKLKTYPVKIENGQVWVGVPEPVEAGKSSDAL